MWKCLLCGAEYEPMSHGLLVCKPCDDRVSNRPPQLLMAAERLWGKCYQKVTEDDGAVHWEFSTARPDGRANPIMLDGRQRPAAQVALFLSGQAQPSKDHVVRIKCGRKLCVKPDHLEWAERLTGSALKWGYGLSYEAIAEMLDAHRGNRAKYQRNYRQKLKRYGVRSMKEITMRELDARAPSEVAASRVAAAMIEEKAGTPAPVHVPWRDDPWVDEPEAPAFSPEPSEPVSEPVAKPSALLTLLSGAKIAPVD